MRVFVVMGNDFPDAVFSTETAAETHCEQCRADDKERARKEGLQQRVFWRVYPFEVKETA